MNREKFKNLIFFSALFVCLTATTAHARVLLEDFTHEIHELRYSHQSSTDEVIITPEVKDGKLCFDYSSAPQDGTWYGRNIVQDYINAEKTMYVDFTFERNAVDGTIVGSTLRNYDVANGDCDPFYMVGSTLTLGYRSATPKTMTYNEKSGRVTYTAEDVEGGCYITVYLNGEQVHSYTETDFYLKAGQYKFQTWFQTQAKQNEGDTVPVICFDNIKIIQDELPPTELYAAEAELHYDFENSGNFLMCESVFPFYKVKSVRQIANFSNETLTCENILAQRGGGDGYAVEHITLQPGEVYLAELTEDAAHLNKINSVESMVLKSFSTLAPLITKHMPGQTVVRSELPEVFAQKLEQVGDVHPRLLTTGAELANTTEYLHTDDTFADMYEALVDWKNTHAFTNYMTCEIPAYGDQRSALCDMIYHRATVWGYLYQTTRNEQYAADLMRDMLKVASYQSWYDPQSYPGGMFLHTSHIARSMGIGYDFIYDYLCKSENADEKQAIERAIYQNAICKYIDFHRADVMDNGNPWQRRSENFNMICNSGVATAALAIGNIPEYRQDCAVALGYALRSARYSAQYINAEGGYTEGPNYYAYMMTHGNDFFASLVNTFGDDYGYREVVGLNATADDPLILAGSKYAYAYADTPAVIDKNVDTMAYFAKYLDRPELGYFRRDWFNKAYAQVEENNAAKSTLRGTYSVKDLLWYDPSFKNVPENAGKPGYDDQYGLPLDYCYRGEGMVALHSDYGDTQGFAAANFGKNSDWHNQTDMGGFVYEAQGEQWFVELGAVGTSWTYGNSYDDRRYRNKPEGHNCMIFNPVQDDYDQIVAAEGKLAAEPVFGEDESYFIMDISSAYADRLDLYQRMIYLNKDTQGFAVRDRFTLKGEDNEYYWFAHTKAEINIDENDPTTAILTQNGKQLKVHVEGGEFTEMEAERLFEFSEASGLVADPANTGVTKLAVHATGARGTHAIIVTAVPLDDEGNGTLPDISHIFFPGETDIHGAGAETFGTAVESAKGNFWWVDNKENFYGGSSPRNKSDHEEGFRMITVAGGPNGEDDYYAKIERDTTVSKKAQANESRLAYRVNHGWGAQPEESRKTWNDGIVRVNYDLKLPNYTDEGVDWPARNNTTKWSKYFVIGLGKWESETLVMWDSDVHPGSFGFEGSTSDAADYTNIKMGEWTHHEWVLDYTTHTMQLWQDGVAIMNTDSSSAYYGTPTLEMNVGHKVYDGFEGIWFKWNVSKGDFGVDNLEIEYELAVPYVKSVDFGQGKARDNKVLTSATGVAVEIPGRVYSADGNAKISDYVSLVDSGGNTVLDAKAEMDADGKTVNVTIPSGALIAGMDYHIKLDKGIPYGREGHTIVPKGVDGKDPQEYTCIVKTTAAEWMYKFTATENINAR
ncbi:MAG: hypothetical protein E7409_07310 [Ruminococcaceae bacterium]|nr:hypothetical protein [Oscillospiraceae bacterium]